MDARIRIGFKKGVFNVGATATLRLRQSHVALARERNLGNLACSYPIKHSLVPDSDTTTPRCYILILSLFD